VSIREPITPVPHGLTAAFDKEASGNYKLAMRFGEAISGWDDPAFVSVRDASHMRDDDYVMGFTYRGLSRAYPLWIVDHYHVVNDIFDGERVMVVSCERCQSGAAFVAAVDGNPGREPLFRSVGFVNATLLLKDMRTGSHWLHYEGVGLDRKAAGVRLPWIQTFHMEWKDWVEHHPDTEVMIPPVDPIHPDARHGHGREEMFARPGMEAGFLSTVVGPLDDTYHENEMILGFETAAGSTAYPYREVQREGGVAYDTSGDTRIAVLAGPRPDGLTMAAYVVPDDLKLTRADGVFIDDGGARWSIEGIALDGPRTGERLEQVPTFYVRWHAWIYFHRDTRLFESTKERPAYELGAFPSLEPFDGLLSTLIGAGHEVIVGEPLVSQRRPRECVSSATVYVDGDRVHLHSFATETAAKDFDALSGVWSGFPLKPRAIDAKTRRVGTTVLESDPDERYVDPAKVIPLPPSVVPWAKVLTAQALDDITPPPPADRPEHIGFAEFVRTIRIAGSEVIDVGFLSPSQLRVGTENAIALTIDAERFLLYRFSDVTSANAYAGTEEHSRAFGPFVLRSTPESMYLHQGAEIIYTGDHTIRWSDLLDEPRLVKALDRLIDEAREQGKVGTT
jgi:hypothetical protein